MRVGILALQGDVAEHAAVVRACGAENREVRRPEDLAGVEALIIPGGESTTIGRLMARVGLDEAIRERVEQGLPVLGTCAGAILLAREARGGRPPLLEVMDIAVARNAYGRQRESFEADIHVPPLGSAPLRVAFIRAPVIEAVGPAVQVLASFGGQPVLVRQDRLLAATFHPEVLGETALHRYFLETVVRAA
ncbi:MAG: pyridoxal 5'-phosphate synthase glutaminase subunit PdxT [Armatimonadota bacterium]|nr:pyridoxal 5'-phosphate synthase glutaminase subunit PdxT [Armatimonadota bacterium]MDR7592322.1 pyridoxal 5'-phosphate synthase glutaminase subunit PdxT [Armatimonadota bacterium]